MAVLARDSSIDSFQPNTKQTQLSIQRVSFQRIATEHIFEIWMKSNYLYLRGAFRQATSPSSSSLPPNRNPEVTYHNAIQHHTPLRVFASHEEALDAVNKPPSANPSKWVKFIAAADKPTNCKFRLFKCPDVLRKQGLEEKVVQDFGVEDSHKDVSMHLYWLLQAFFAFLLLSLAFVMFLV